MTGRFGFTHAVRMEWIKLRSLRSTPWALLAAVVGMITIGVVTMANTKAPGSAAKAATFDATNNVLAGVALGQLVIGVLAVLTVTGEYASGSIRSTLAAIPDRRLLLGAKAAVLGGASIILGQIVSFVTFFAGTAVLTDEVRAPALDQPGVLRAVVLAGAYLGLIALLGVGLGAITRHTASALAAFVGITFVLPAVFSGLTGITIAKFFPTMIAANSLAVAKPVEDMLSPWAGFGMLCGYTALVLAAGGWLLTRRDA